MQSAILPEEPVVIEESPNSQLDDEDKTSEDPFLCLPESVKRKLDDGTRGLEAYALAPYSRNHLP